MRDPRLDLMWLAIAERLVALPARDVAVILRETFRDRRSKTARELQALAAMHQRNGGGRI